jgi:tetratricopeptide (TPR) repeat protein
MSTARRALHAQYPRPAAHSHVVEMNLPRGLMYALGGDRAVQVWYRDTTLSMVNYARLNVDSTLSMVAGVQFQPGREPAIVLLSPDAMHAQDRAYHRIRAGAWEASFPLLAAADSLQPDPRDVVFHGDNAGYRAFALLQLHRHDEAEAEARRALALTSTQRNGMTVLSMVFLLRGELDEALALADHLLRIDKSDASAQRLRAAILARKAAEQQR